MTAAPSRRSATGPPSSVADITRIFRSSRRARRISRHSASARSACRLRSWNSSKITMATPSRAGLARMRRVRIPSVITSMRVLGETRLSNRMEYPSVRPISSPSVLAIHRAAETAAIRRGSSIRMRPFSGGRTSSSARGTRVVFPEPGGACRTRAECFRTASFTSGRMSSIG